MKKILTTFLCLLFISSFSQESSEKDQKESPHRIGLKMLWEQSKLRGKIFSDNYMPAYLPSIGFQYFFDLTQNICFESGVYIQNRGYQSYLPYSPDIEFELDPHKWTNLVYSSVDIPFKN